MHLQGPENEPGRALELHGIGSWEGMKPEAGLESISQHVLLVQGSGRNWKEPSQRASSVKNPILTSSWEKKMQQKAAHQRYKEVKQAAIDVRKQKLQVCVMHGIAALFRKTSAALDSESQCSCALQ